MQARGQSPEGIEILMQPYLKSAGDHALLFAGMVGIINSLVEIIAANQGQTPEQVFGELALKLQARAAKDQEGS
jgi:hypothetical protein